MKPQRIQQNTNQNENIMAVVGFRVKVLTAFNSHTGCFCQIKAVALNIPESSC